MRHWWSEVSPWEWRSAPVSATIGGMVRVLVPERIAPRGLDRIREAGHEVDEQLDLDAAGLLDAVKGAHALVIRSETQVTDEVLAVGSELVVVGRAGIGLDNVDVAAATRRGVMVCNAPQSNIVSAAEHAMALLLAQARNIPTAHGSLTAGRWERSRFTGVELHGKRLGVIGLGRIGKLVAQRAHSFGMQLAAYDPHVTRERASQIDVELMSLEDLLASSDFVTIHLPKTPETVGLLDAAALKHAKLGLRLVNTARGGIVDESALAEAISEGRVAGAAIDVFAKEPCTESPLFRLPSVVVTPHLAASTREAQDKAGETIAEQVVLALAGEFVPYAVNVNANEASETVRPFLPLAERLGRIFASLGSGVAARVDITYQGDLADYDTSILSLAVTKGLLEVDSPEPVSFVNAPQLAEARGLSVGESRDALAHDYVNLITLRSDAHSLAGTVFGLRHEARLVMVDDHLVDIPPARHMVIVRNEDVPGVIGTVGTTLGEAGVNISDMDVGRSPSGEAALMVLSTDEPVAEEVLDALRSLPGVREVGAATYT